MFYLYYYNTNLNTWYVFILLFCFVFENATFLRGTYIFMLQNNVLELYLTVYNITNNYENIVNRNVVVSLVV